MTTAFSRTPYGFTDMIPYGFILQTWINMCAESFIKTLVNVSETRIYEGAWKKIVTQIQPSVDWYFF